MTKPACPVRRNKIIRKEKLSGIPACQQTGVIPLSLLIQIVFEYNAKPYLLLGVVSGLRQVKKLVFNQHCFVKTKDNYK